MLGCCAAHQSRLRARLLQSMHFCACLSRAFEPNPSLPGRNYNFFYTLSREAALSPSAYPFPNRLQLEIRPVLPDFAVLARPFKNGTAGRSVISSGDSGRLALEERSKTGARLVPSLRGGMGNAQATPETRHLTRQTNLPSRNLSIVSCVSTQSYQKSTPRFPEAPYAPQKQPKIHLPSPPSHLLYLT